MYQGYKPKTHDIALLATQTSSLHESLAGALPREAPEDERLFQLLRRAYIEARYTESYRVTDEELASSSSACSIPRRACAAPA